MRRRILPLLPLAFAACAESAMPRVGVVVSSSPSQAVPIALAHSGNPFEAVIRATAESAGSEDALEVAEELVSDPSLIAVIGHSNSAASLAASQVYNAAKVVQIAATSTAPVYDDAGPFSFRLVPSDTAQARFLVDALHDGWPEAQRIAVVYVNDDYGRGLFRHARPHMRNVVFEGMYADVADTTNLFNLGDRVAAARPDVLLWLGRPWRLRNLLERVRPVLPDVDVLCSDACDEPTVNLNDGGDFTGVRFVRFVDPRDTAAAVRALQQEYRARVDELATLEALLVYDAAQLIAAAVHDGVDSGDALRRWLGSLGRSRPPFEGIAGPISFDETGSARRPYLLAEVVAHDSVVSVPVPRR